MKNKQIYFNDQYEYDLIEDGDVISLHYNNSDNWTKDTRGKLIMSIENTGNGYKVKNLKSKKDFDYSDVVHLNILMSYIQDYKLEISEKIPL